METATPHQDLFRSASELLASIVERLDEMAEKLADFEGELEDLRDGTGWLTVQKRPSTPRARPTRSTGSSTRASTTGCSSGALRARPRGSGDCTAGVLTAGSRPSATDSVLIALRSATVAASDGRPAEQVLAQARGCEKPVGPHRATRALTRDSLRMASRMRWLR